MEDMELVCFKIISAVGEAKSNYVLAMDEAEKGNYDKADELIKQGDECSLKGHLVHADLIQKEASGDKTEVSLLLMHAEDQLMAAETIKIMCERVIQLQKRLDK